MFKTYRKREHDNYSVGGILGQDKTRKGTNTKTIEEENGHSGGPGSARWNFCALNYISNNIYYY